MNDKIKKGVKEVRRGLLRIAFGFFLRFVIRLAYIAGLTMIIPILFFVTFPSEVADITGKLIPSLMIAIGLILISAFLMRWYRESWASTFKSLGAMTFIPGAVALLFAIFGRNAILDWTEKNVIGFTQLEPLITEYLNRALPRVWILTVAYFGVGLLLIIWGMRSAEKRERRKQAYTLLGRKV